MKPLSPHESERPPLRRAAPPRFQRFGLPVLAALGLFILPRAASANAGTPLIWAGILHLAFGNILIGIGEGLIISRLFAVPCKRTVPWMILANYISAWAGGLFLRGAIVDALPLDLNNGWQWFWIMVILAYLATLVLEWPFVAWCVRGRDGWLSQSLLGSVAAQSASYVLLFGWYWAASGTSLYTGMRVVKPSEIPLPEAVSVYYISGEDGDVYQRRLTGEGGRKICGLGAKGKNDRLLVRANASDSRRWDLVAYRENGAERDHRLVEIRPGLEIDCAPDWRVAHLNPPQYEGTWFNFGQVEPLGGARTSSWQFVTGFWPVEGLTARNQATGERLRFSYETPFGSWTIRNAVHLPTDKVLFQLGTDQICLFDPATRRVALLWHGQGPVPVIEK